jgi:hypothetical protein
MWYVSISVDGWFILRSVQDPTPIYEESPGLDTETSAEALRIASQAAALAAAQASKAPTVISTTPVADAVPTQAVTDTHKPGQGEEKGSGKEASSSTSKPTDRPLILYAYADSSTGSARINLEFFIAHALHDAADFVFILNGETDVEKLIPEKKNIRYVKRPNDCYDLGAYAEVLLANDFYKGYKRFITLNASIRGPFIPYWSNACWSDMYLNKVTDEVKVRSLLSLELRLTR